MTTVTGLTPAAIASLIAASVPVDWINVTKAPYNADPTGATDSTSAIRAALVDAAARSVATDNPLGGGTVYLPWGVYLISGSLNIPPQTYLVGQGNITLPIAAFDVQYGGARLKASASWAPSSTAGVVQFLSKTPGGWLKNMEQSGLRNIVIDCSANTSTNLSGILHVGPVYDIHLQDVLINKAGHNGIHATVQTETGIAPQLPYHHYYERVTCYNSVNTGFNVSNFTDSTFSQCMAFGSGGSGWVLAGMQDSIFTACRAQWNTANGFILTSTGGHLLFTGCETDNNGQCGLVINSTSGSGGAITVSGWISEADGRASSAAALYIHNCATPVVISGFTQGMDLVSGIGAPKYGLQVASNTAPVTITGCYFEGSTAAILNGGSNTNLTMSGVVAGTGTIGSLAYENYDSTDFLNATWFGADPTGTADSTIFIQAALSSAANGQPVYLPKGTYKTTSPLTLAPGQVLIGASGWDSFAFGDAGAVIKPSASFSGTEVLYLADSGSAVTQGAIIRDLGIDGSSLPGTTDGIRAFGPVVKTVIQNVAIASVTGWGINCIQDSGVSSGNSYPYDWEVSHVRIHHCAGGGANLPDHTDSTWTDVYVLGCGGTSGHGFQFTSAPGNSHFIGCRAEWTGTGDGWHLTGAWGNVGTFMMTACSTDRNQKNGFYCDATGSFAPVMLSNCRFNRDGRNGGSGGGSYAGVQVSSATVPLMFSNVVVTPGVDDDGTGTNSPQIGFIAANSTYTSISSGWIWGASTSLSNGGGNTAFRVGPNVMLTTGTITAPSYDYDNSWGTDNGSDWTLGGGGRIYLGAQTTPPVCAAGSAAGSGPPAPVITKATDAAGIITFGTGTGPSAGAQVTVTFHRPYGTEPYVVLCPMNDATAALLPYLASPSSTGFTISAHTAPAASQANTVYAVSWIVMG